jgi:hypothetical protein
MYVGPILLGSLTAGVIFGKVVADIVFYTLAIVGYEFGKTLANSSTGTARVVGWASAEQIRPAPTVGWAPDEATTAELRVGSRR